MIHVFCTFVEKLRIYCICIISSNFSYLATTLAQRELQMPRLVVELDPVTRADLDVFQAATLSHAARMAKPPAALSVTLTALVPALLRHAMSTLKPADVVALLHSAQSHPVAPSEQPKKPPRAERLKLWDEK
jgi:hypothetical protein